MPDGPRIIVVGTSGSGKTTLARAVARRLAIPHVELDALHWLPRWTERPLDEFLGLTAERLSGPAWVVDGNYSSAQDVVWPRGTHIVWLNYSRSVVMRRVLWRTLSRAVLRTEIFSGNRESLRMSFFSSESILWWAWTTHGPNRQTYRTLFDGPEHPHLRRIELRTPHQAAAWLESLDARALLLGDPTAA
jgi:adenylate kinase family enzyme